MDQKKDLFENTSVGKAVLKLALPSVLGQIILVIYNMADTLFIGMTGSDELITAVTVCMPAFMFLSAVSNLFGVGSASVISRALGRKDARRARLASAFAVWGCLTVTVLYCLAVFLLRDGFLDLLGGSDPVVHRNAAAYLTVAVILGGTATSMSTLMSHLIRATGFSFEASLGIVIGGVLNIGLDPLFMFVILPKGQEALGAAIATALSNLCSLSYYLLVIIFRRKRFSLSIRFRPEMLREGIPSDIFRVGIPACLMTLCENISYAVLDNLIAASGTAAQAGIGVAKKVNMLAHSFVRGMSQGVLPLIGYNYASGSRKRMKSVIFFSAGVSFLIALSCLGVNALFSEELIGLFIRTEADSLRYGAAFLRILSIGAPFSAWAYAVISFFQATGRGGSSLILALMRKGLIDIPLMLLLNKRIPTFGIVAATPITDILCCVTAAVLFAIFIREHGTDKSACNTGSGVG